MFVVRALDSNTSVVPQRVTISYIMRQSETLRDTQRWSLGIPGFGAYSPTSYVVKEIVVMTLQLLELAWLQR